MHAPDETATIVVDAEGNIVSWVGGLRNLPANLKGRPWRQALATVADVSELPHELPPHPQAYDMRARDGADIVMHASPTTIADQRFTLVLLRRGQAMSDTDLRRERMVTLGSLAVGAAHEMNNVLTLISGWLQLLLADEPDEDRRDKFQLLVESSDRLSSLTRNLLDFARAPLSKVGPVPLNTAVEEMLALINYRLDKGAIQLRRELAVDLPLMSGNLAELAHAILNLLINAMRAMPDGGVLRVRTYAEKDEVVVAIADTGCGMSPEMQARIFKPFFTTRAENGGSGLGLLVCSEIVAKHGGEIAVRSEVNKGTEFTMRFPARTETTADVLVT